MNVAGENTVYDVGERKRGELFSFNVADPLHVRTKTRQVFTRVEVKIAIIVRVVVKRGVFRGDD